MKIEELETVKIYDYYDMPLLYTAKDNNGSLFLILYIDTPDCWACMPVSLNRISELENHIIDLYTAFSQTEHGIYIIDENGTEFVDNIIEEQHLPIKGEYL